MTLCLENVNLSISNESLVNFTFYSHHLALFFAAGTLIPHGGATTNGDVHKNPAMPIVPYTTRYGVWLHPELFFFNEIFNSPIQD